MCLLTCVPFFCRGLHKENTSLRERLEVMEYMMMSATTAGVVPASEESGGAKDMNIPGYGVVADVGMSSDGGKHRKAVMEEMMFLRRENESLKDQIRQVMLAPSVARVPRMLFQHKEGG
jgi:hypothetical protein